MSNSLARAGILDSSIALDKQRDLTEADAAMGREIASKGKQFENMARNQITNAKQSLLEQNAALAESKAKYRSRCMVIAGDAWRRVIK